jgi:hypothetical protein
MLRSAIACRQQANMSHSDPGYQCYAELAKARAEGTDFTVSISRRPNRPSHYRATVEVLKPVRRKSHVALPVQT